MIVVSMLLVIVGAVTLVIGVFFADESLTFVYVSILSCLLAGVFLVIGIIRGRPSRQAASSAPEGQPSWSPQPGPVSSAQDTAPGGRPAPSPFARERDEPAPVGGGPAATSDAEEATDTPSEDETTPLPAAAAVGARSEEDTEEPTEEPAGEPAAPPRKRLSLRKGAAKKSVAKSAKKAAPRPAAEAAPVEQAPAEEVPAAEEPVEAVPVAESTPEDAPGVAVPAPARKRSTLKKATKKASKKAAAKKASKKAAGKKAAKKAAGKKASKKAAGKKAAKTAVASPQDRAEFAGALAGVSGVGPAKVDSLFERFGSVEALRNSSVEELAETKGVSETIAQRILEQLGG